MSDALSQSLSAQLHFENKAEEKYGNLSNFDLDQADKELRSEIDILGKQSEEIHKKLRALLHDHDMILYVWKHRLNNRR